MRAVRISLVFLAGLSAAAPDVYRSVSVDAAGRLHIRLDSGREILPAKARGQVAFSDPAISPDGRTVGWLALYPFPNPPGATYRFEPIPGMLALYRGGRVLHEFHTEQVFWDWQFQDGGKRVAYSTGPTHGGAAECVLRDVESGAIIARVSANSGVELPAWARPLRK